MQEIRHRKTADFNKFYDQSKVLFKSLRDNDSSAKFFEDYYMLSVCSGSRAGGTDKRMVEVFWGKRPYDFEEIGDSWKAFTETGSILSIYRNDTSDVTISLFPAKTEFRRPFEDSITLYQQLDPQKLNDPKLLKSLWKSFMAYTEYTSLDGKPTFTQKLKVFYLKSFKHLTVDKQWRPTRISVFVKDLLKWVLTVGFSGIIVLIVTIMMQPKTTETEFQLKEINKKMDKITRQMDEKL